MQIPLTASLHYLIASLDGYMHFKMSACKIEFIVPSFFVLQLSENDYTAVYGYGWEIQVLMQGPGQVSQSVLSSVLWQHSNHTQLVN